MRYNEEEMLEKIIEIVNSNPDGSSIAEISRKLGVSRLTASKYISYLIGKGKVRLRKLGTYKLLYPKRR